jgi:hypothetical protein
LSHAGNFGKDTFMYVSKSCCLTTIGRLHTMLNFVNVRIFSTILLLCLTFQIGMAQDEDYYKAEKSRDPITTSDLNHLYRWGPKLGIEAFGSIGYSHFYTPLTISGAFDKAKGGFGYDGGIGIRIRVYHKLSIATGFVLSGRGYEMGFPAEADTGNGGTQIWEIDVSEKANITYTGFYIKPGIELSRKFHLAVLFKQTWQIAYKGESTQTVTAPASAAGSTGTFPETSVELEPSQFELGLEFAYKWNIAPQMILKPHIGINFATSGIFHTGAELPTPFGGWEQNPSFMTLRFGVIFETGLWLDKLKE